MNKTDLLQNLKTYLENNYLRSKAYYITASKFLNEIDDVTLATKEDIKNFLYNSTETKNTFNTYKAHLIALFKFCVEYKIIEKNPFEEIEKFEMVALRESVEAKRTRITYEECLKICDNLIKGGNPIQAAIVSSYYEGISTSELAMIEKEDIHDDYLILKERNNYKFLLNKYHADILKLAAKTTRTHVWVGGVIDVRTDELVETKFLIRYGKRSKIEFEIGKRSKQVHNSYGNLNLGYSINELSMSGMMNYIRNIARSVEDLTEDKIGCVLEKYNVSWIEYYELIKGEF